MRILLIGNRGGTNVGGSLERGAARLGHEVSVLEPRLAYSGSRLAQRLNWWLRGRRPARLDWFDSEILAAVASHHPDVVLTVGISPPGQHAAQELRRRGIRLINYLTDDPWQRRLYARWFVKSLPAYKAVFSTKRAVMQDLHRAGAPRVAYLPFGYDPDLHFPGASNSASERARLESDVFFAGGGDADRYPFLRALIQSGLLVAIHGDRWDRDPVTKAGWRGHANPEQLRQATAAARICLCLVRRANRDGHVMRSLEIAAMRGCMLTEDTPEHRELFGADGECAVFFRDIAEMVAKAKALLPRAEERARLAEAAHRRICSGGHTYADRLQEMISSDR